MDQPFVDCLGGMSHEDSAAEVGLCENIREGGGMVKVEANEIEVVSNTA